MFFTTVLTKLSASPTTSSKGLSSLPVYSAPSEGVAVFGEISADPPVPKKQKISFFFGDGNENRARDAEEVESRSLDDVSSNVPHV